MMSGKNLPLGIQDFEDFKEGNYIYVDKTQYIYELIQPFKAFYFLSRPRRFGKSLLLSTFKALFEGKKELFNDLWISKNTDYSWEKHPVIKIDFNGISHKDDDVLKNDILAALDIIIKSMDWHLQHSHFQCASNI